MAKDLAAVGEKIENEYGIPIVNKRISVTPIALVGGAVQDAGRFCNDCGHAGPRSQDGWGELDRRLFGTGVEGHDEGG